MRKAGESVATFVSELRCLSEFCNFGETLEDMIRDRLVCGINDDAIQKRMLAEPTLSYKKAVELALSMETAAQSMKELRLKTGADVNHFPKQQEVHRMTTTASTSGQGGTKSVPHVIAVASAVTVSASAELAGRSYVTIVASQGI